MKLALQPHCCLEVSSLAFELGETTLWRNRALATVDLSVAGSPLGCTVGESLGTGSIS